MIGSQYLSNKQSSGWIVTSDLLSHDWQGVNIVTDRFPAGRPEITAGRL